MKSIIKTIIASSVVLASINMAHAGTITVEQIEAHCTKSFGGTTTTFGETEASNLCQIGGLHAATGKDHNALILNVGTMINKRMAACQKVSPTTIAFRSCVDEDVILTKIAYDSYVYFVRAK